MSRRPTPGTVLALFLGLTAAGGAGAAPVPFEVDTVDGRPLRGPVVSLGEKWQLRLDGQEKALSSAPGIWAF